MKRRNTITKTTQPPPARITLTALLAVITLFAPSEAAEDDTGHPLLKKQRDMLRRRFERVVQRQSKTIAANAQNIRAYSRRGDAYFFLGRFNKAVADYEKMIELNPKLEASHWRRGIAYFYAGQYKKAARQFELYNTVDMVDRENGIWRFFSQAKADGLKQARRNLLKYQQTDREPFADVYKLFSQQMTPETILTNITTAEIDKREREKRLFYAHLYIGLNHALHKRNTAALKHLRKAVANTWGPKAGFGPTYMWHVGRLHYELLLQKTKQPSGS